LRELAEHENEAVQRAALKNPALPEDVWREQLLFGMPEAWDNPLAPICLLVWTPQEGDRYPLELAIRLATHALWKEPDRLSSKGKALLNTKILEWWATSVSAIHMIEFLWPLAYSKGSGSPEHKELVRIIVLCVRTMPRLNAKDRQALDLLEAWCAGGEDQRLRAETLASSNPVQLTVEFAKDPWVSYYAWGSIFAVLKEFEVGKDGTKREDAMAKQNLLLADLIRREMPLPPQVN